MLRQQTDEKTDGDHSNGSSYRIPLPKDGEEIFLVKALKKGESLLESIKEDSELRNRKIVITSNGRGLAFWHVDPGVVRKPEGFFVRNKDIPGIDREEILSIEAGFAPEDWVPLDQIKPMIEEYFGGLDGIEDVRIRKRNQLLELYRPIN